jgi:hypothetical protein
MPALAATTLADGIDRLQIPTEPTHHTLAARKKELEQQKNTPKKK